MSEKKLNKKPGLRAFSIFIFGEGLSQLGSTMTGFALGIWAYQQFGNVTDLAVITAAAAFPRVLLGPFAGSYVDRWDRKSVLLFGQLVSFLITLTIAILYWNDMLAVWHMVVLNILAGISGAFVMPAIQSSISLLVDKTDIQRANGMMGLLMGLVMVFSPALAGMLIATIGIDGILVIDIVSFSAALFVLLWINIPKPIVSSDGAEAVKGDLIAEMKFGWMFLYSRPGLFWLTILNSILAMGVLGLSIMITPVVLGFSDEKGLGFILSAGGVGLILGGLAVIITGGVQRKIYAVLGTSALSCIGMMILPIFTTVNEVALGMFLLMSFAPLGTSASQSIIQLKIPTDIQGRVFGLRNFLLGIGSPIALLIIAPAADHFFEPLLLEGGGLVDSVGILYGAGPGRGMAFLNSLMGSVMLLVVILAYLYPPVRRVDIDLPDYID